MTRTCVSCGIGSDDLRAALGTTCWSLEMRESDMVRPSVCTAILSYFMLLSGLISLLNVTRDSEGQGKLSRRIVRWLQHTRYSPAGSMFRSMDTAFFAARRWWDCDISFGID